MGSHGPHFSGQIKTLTKADFQRWDQFVADCPSATFFHRAGWQDVLQQGLGHNTHFLYAEAENNGAIQGILPLAHIRSRFFGNSLISLPLCVYAGVIANSEAAHSALTNAACELAEALSVDCLELRHQQRIYPDWPVKDGLYFNFRKAIDPDPAVNLTAIPRKQRASIRKSTQMGLHSEIDQQTKRFYAANSEKWRNLGTPVLPHRYFRTLKKVFDDDCEILTITQQGKLVASVMSFYFRDQVLPYYMGSTALARRFKGDDFMYWELMQRAAERGIRVFDFGRSKVGTGPYHYKKHWGFEPQPLNYEFYLIKANELPDINPLNPKYQLFIKLWRHLPIPLSQFLGPFISRSLS